MSQELHTDSPLARRRLRVRTIRRRVSAGAVALFIAAFGGITVQLVTGHDPALATTSTKAGVTTQASPSSSQAASSTGSGSSTGASSTGQSSAPLSPVTTSQS